MLLTVGIGLYATRLVFSTLTESDVGTLATLTAAVSFGLILFEGISAAAERTLAFEFGRGDPARTARAFSTLVAVFGVAALIVLIAVFALGRFIPDWCSVPAARYDAAVTSALLIGAMIATQVLSAPFRSMFIARQSMGVLTISDVVDSVGKLLAIIGVSHLPGDKLVNLCALSFAAQAASGAVTVIACNVLFPAGRFKPSLICKATLRELASFTSWSIVGNVSYRLRMAGPPLALSATSANPAYLIATTIASYQLSIAGALNRAVGPAIVAAWGRGDRARVLDLVCAFNRYATLIALFYIIPIALETPTLLAIWLKTGTIPAFAPEFVRLVMFQMGLSWIYMGYHHAAIAHGSIAKYMLIAVGMEVLTLALAWGTLLIPGVAPWSMSVTITAMTLLTITIYVRHISKLIDTPFSRWITGTWLPVLAVAIPSTGLAYLTRFVMPEGFLRLCLTTAVYMFSAALLAWLFAMTLAEKTLARSLLGGLARKLRLIPKRSAPPTEPTAQS